jgi:LysM repeat protein
MNLRTLTAALLVAIALVACGGDAPEEGASPSPSEAASVSAEPTESEPAEPADQSDGKTRTYEVKSGDTLSEIAEQFDTTVKALVKANKLKDAHSIRAGQKLTIPAGG